MKIIVYDVDSAFQGTTNSIQLSEVFSSGTGKWRSLLHLVSSNGEFKIQKFYLNVFSYIFFCNENFIYSIFIGQLSNNLLHWAFKRFGSTVLTADGIWRWSRTNEPLGERPIVQTWFSWWRYWSWRWNNPVYSLFQRDGR